MPSNHPSLSALSAWADAQDAGFVTFNQAGIVNFVSPAFHRLMACGPVQLEGLDETGLSHWLVQQGDAGVAFSGIATLRQRSAADAGYAGEVIEISRPEKKRLRVKLHMAPSDTISLVLSLHAIASDNAQGQITSQLLSKAAHDLRTPLASIAGFTEILQTQEFDASTQQEFLGIIAEQAQLMARFLDQLLDLSRLESRQGHDFQFAPVGVQQLVADAIKNYPLPAQGQPPEYKNNEAPLYVMADAGKLRQVIGLVLSNAFKFSPAGATVSVRVESQASATRAPTACIHISDNGMGMTPAQTLRIFDPLYRADTSGKIPGSGLGMSVAKAIMALHHGEILITSTPQQGTRVSLLLPTQLMAASTSP